MSGSGGSSGSTNEAGAAGAGPQDVVNTGGCGPSPDLGRGEYQASGTALWVPDCKTELLREYWRVMTEDRLHGYTIPRIDGAAQLAPVCADPTHALYVLVERYELCTPADSEARVELVNSMSLADALMLTHYMHQVLRFELTPGGLILPHPFKQDLLDACQLAENSAELTVICEKEQREAQQAFTYASPGGEQLAERLNQLYGVN